MLHQLLGRACAIKNANSVMFIPWNEETVSSHHPRVSKHHPWTTHTSVWHQRHAVWSGGSSVILCLQHPRGDIFLSAALPVSAQRDVCSWRKSEKHIFPRAKQATTALENESPSQICSQCFSIHPFHAKVPRSTSLLVNPCLDHFAFLGQQK